MTDREKAPGWVVLGILIFSLFFSVIGFLGFLGIMPVNKVLYSDEYNQSVGFSYYTFWWLMDIIPILFYSWIAITSIIGRWHRAVTVGACLLAVNSVVSIIFLLMELSAKDYYELHFYFDFLSWFYSTQTILHIVGILLLVWNTNVSKVLKICITAYELLINCLSYLAPYFQEMDMNMYLIVGKPLLVIIMFVIWFYDNRTKTIK